MGGRVSTRAYMQRGSLAVRDKLRASVRQHKRQQHLPPEQEVKRLGSAVGYHDSEVVYSAGNEVRGFDPWSNLWPSPGSFSLLLHVQPSRYLPSPQQSHKSELGFVDSKV